MKRFFVSLTLVFATAAVWAFAEPANAPLRLGVLAYRPKPQTLEQWKPVADYLQTALGQPVELAVYDHAELSAAAAQRAVDVVITSPNHFIQLQQTIGLSSALATLVTLEGTNQLSAYGGVILARSDRSDIATLADLAGKRIAVVSTDAFGGYQAQAIELLDAGLPLPTDGLLLITGQPHDRVVEAVLEGRADAGFVRAGVLESLEQKGRIVPARVKVINRQSHPTFPYALSTRLYPEWPVAVLPQVEPRLASRLAGALFLLPTNTLGSASGVCGFTIPANYDGVQHLMRRLRLPPFDRPPEITLADLWRRHAFWLCALATLLLLLAASSVSLVFLYRRSLWSLRERLRVDAALQESETKHRIVADNTYDWEFWQAPDGRMLYSSPSCKRLTGHDAKEFLTDAGLFRRIIHPEDVERYDQHVAESHQRQAPSGLEYRMMLPDGSVRWIDHICQAVFDNTGNYLGRRGSNRDISERKRAEQALVQLNQELEQRVKARTAELEAKNHELEQTLKVFVGRELRMAELKEKLRTLEKPSQ